MHTYTHIVWWFLWNNNLYYTAVPSTRVRNSQFDATTEQNADLHGPWMNWTEDRPHYMYARTKQTVATVPYCLPRWVSCWAPKKSRSLRLIEILWSQASVARVHHTTAWILNIWRTAHARLVYTTHTFATFVNSCKDSTRTQLGLGLATPSCTIDILDYVTGIGNEIARTNHSVQTPAARQCRSI